ncbi:MAG: TonB-dependent receptor [Kofleriaceae bacterium]|jgi:outer membrane receptor protein involved in Fe transport|nr:TonB-dependent receptor [Kofleriaceae bacterium]MBP9166129.1 TonB-dependent receptor [Kofleriaceae bacterium]MBP9856959.1 TonB-dependent receptor [Kofleriaceae bacterium]
MTRSSPRSPSGWSGRRALARALVAALVASPSVVAAQEAPAPVDIEVPVVVIDLGPAGEDGDSRAADEQLDLANIVQSAAKGVTTVQEAPAIVTVITADELRDRQFQTIDQALDTVPGYQRNGFIHSQFPSNTARGTGQALQFLHDSLSLFDPYLNIPTTNRLQPLETIKRIETITGPGGVLWGANSFLGVVNVITKDADDVDGIEVGGQLGHGDGDQANARAYAMAGFPDLLDGKLKAFVHAAVETYGGPAYEMPLHMFSAPLPQPNSVDFYGPLSTASPPRSTLFNFLGKFTYGKLQLRVQAPLIERHTPLGFPGFVVRETLPEDERCGPSATPEQLAQCFDPQKKSRDNQVNFYDRYAVLEYRDRFAEGRAGLKLQGYVSQFVRDFAHLGVLAPIGGLLNGGLAFGFDATSYRTGGAIEGDVELPSNLRLQYGAEAFREFAFNNVDRSRQGDGIQSIFFGPYDLSRLPLPCPREPDPENPGNSRIIADCPLTFAFPASRTVLGAYLNPQWRPRKKLILDAGVRVQAAPARLGLQSYPLTTLFSSTAVWNFVPNWHLKLNFAQGFRPPVFNNTNSNGEAVQIDGRPDLKVETSDAAQVEVNARIFKGKRRIRELSFRTDYSYTRLQNTIQVVSGRYENTADRGIHSVEALAKLYITGGHRIELDYTFLRVNTADKGIQKSLPEHMFHLTGVWNVIDDKLAVTTDLRVVGAIEDPNRLIEYRGYRETAAGEVFNRPECQVASPPSSCVIPVGTIVNANGEPELVRSEPSHLVLDRLPPAADLSFGFTYQPMKDLTVRGTVFNAFNARYYQPDIFFDYEPRLEFLPNPWEDWRAYLSVQYNR